MPLRACLRLQCFPESFRPFPFCLYTAGKQVGNAFPPILIIPDLIQILHALGKILNPEELVRQLTLDLILQARPLEFTWSKVLHSRTYSWSPYEQDTEEDLVGAMQTWFTGERVTGTLTFERPGETQTLRIKWCTSLPADSVYAEISHHFKEHTVHVSINDKPLQRKHN